MSVRVVHVNDGIPGAVYIGRAVPRKGIAGSPLGNPFRIGRGGTRADVIRLYRNHLDGALASRRGPEIAEALIGLRGKPIACWCRHDGEGPGPENACHGDVILGLLATRTDEELRAMAASRIGTR